ncbi:hypothetical protein KR044_009243 [Drosophila immigrans]|nr:hypothetical protein KR044_009243 [Drosophila immigrans]
MKVTVVIGFLLCLSLSCSVNALSCPEKCPDTEELVWALGGRCYLYLNKCEYDKENCKRETPLKIVTREECQPYCAAFCPENYKPVEGNLRHFGHACEKIAHVCRTGELLKD